MGSGPLNAKDCIYSSCRSPGGKKAFFHALLLLLFFLFIAGRDTRWLGHRMWGFYFAFLPWTVM